MCARPTCLLLLISVCLCSISLILSFFRCIGPPARQGSSFDHFPHREDPNDHKTRTTDVNNFPNERNMKEEILAAVMFLIRFIEKSETFPRDQLENFKHHLTTLLTKRFEKHWFPEVPAKGQGYRCIRVNGVNPVDMTLEQAASKCGLSYRDLRLPAELTVWVDPSEVCYRLGESEGSYCTLATFPSESSSECSSPSPSPPTTPLQDKSRRVRKLPPSATDPKHRYNMAPVTSLRVKPVPRELSFNMHQNRPPWRCDGPPFLVPPTVYRNMTYNNTRHYKNILRV